MRDWAFVVLPSSIFLLRATSPCQMKMAVYGLFLTARFIITWTCEKTSFRRGMFIIRGPIQKPLFTYGRRRASVVWKNYAACLPLQFGIQTNKPYSWHVTVKGKSRSFTPSFRTGCSSDLRSKPFCRILLLRCLLIWKPSTSTSLINPFLRPTAHSKA